MFIIYRCPVLLSKWHHSLNLTVICVKISGNGKFFMDLGKAILVSPVYPQLVMMFYFIIFLFKTI